jgi:hypothetical protein
MNADEAQFLQCLHPFLLCAHQPASLHGGLACRSPEFRRLKQAEINGGVTIATLARAAQALDCTLVYALVPREPLDTLLQERARAVATAQNRPDRPYDAP